MTEQTVTLRIVGENGKLVAVTRASRAELAALGKAATDTGQQAERGARQVDKVGEASERVRQRANALTGTLRQLKGMLGAYVGVQGLRVLGQTADTYADITGRLKQVTQGERELAEAKAATFAIAQRTYQSLDATVTLYQRSAAALADYGAGQEKVAALTETINRGLLISRASTAEATGAIIQLSQALSAGVLRGEEFNSVNEAAPRIMKLLADSLGVARGELRKMAEDGELTIDVLLEAFTGAKAAELEAEAANVPLTISRAWQQAKNEMLRYVGEQDQAAGSSAAIAQTVALVGRNVDLLAKAVGVLAIAYAGRLLGALTTTTVALVRKNMAAQAGIGVMSRMGAGVATLGRGLVAFAGGPVGIVITGVGLLAAAMINASAKAKQLRQDVISALDGIDDAIASADRKLMASAGERLLSTRQMQADEVARLTANVSDLRFNPIARASGIYEDRQRQLASARDQLERLNVAVQRNARELATATQASNANANATAANAAESKEFNERLADQNEKLRIERIEREQGIRAAIEYQAVKAAGVQDVSQLSDATRVLIDEQVRERAAAEAAKESTSGLARERKQAAKDAERAAEAQRQYANEIRMLEAELAGPIAVAQETYRQRIAEINAALEENRIREADATAARAVAEIQLQRTTATYERKRDIVGRMREALEEDVRVSALSNQERRIEEQVLRAAAEARELYADRVRETAELLPQEAAAIRQMATEAAAMEDFNRAQQAAAEEYQGSWFNAIDSVSRAFGDWLTGGISKFKDFGRTLKDIGKRFLADLIAQFTRNSLVPVFQNWMRQLSSGGFAGAGGGGGFWNQIGGMFGRFFGMGGSPQPSGYAPGAFGSYVPAGSAGTAYGAAIGTLGQTYGGFNQVMPGGVLVPGSSPTGGGSGGFGMAMNPWLAGIGGALYGWQQGGDTAGKALGGAAYGVAGFGLATGAAAGTAAIAGGATLGAGAMAGLAAIPIVGWIALAAIAIDKISGGKLFGTKFKRESSAFEFMVDNAGAEGFTSTTDVRNKSLFRGRKWRTNTQDLDPEAQRAIDEIFDTIMGAVAEASSRLFVNMPDLVAGSFRQEFDAKGNLKKEFGTIAGKVYEEGQEAFIQRLLGENLVAVAKLSGNAGEIEQLAERYRVTGEGLAEFGALIVAIQADVAHARQLWDAEVDGSLTRAVELMERLGRAGESLGETYARVTQAAMDYGQIFADAQTELLTQDLNQYQRAQLDIELSYRRQVKQANELARSLGLAGAKSEHLAVLEQWRAKKMADLQLQMERERDRFVEDLGLSNLSPLRDDQKLTESMQLLRDAAAAGDIQRAQQLSQVVLGLGRNLFASGGDYNDLYATVTGLLKDISPADMGLLGDAELAGLADLIDGLPRRFATELFDMLLAANLVEPPNTVTPPAPPPPANPPPPGDGTGGGGGGGNLFDGGGTLTYQQLVAINTTLQDMLATTQQTLSLQQTGALHEQLNR